VILTATQLYRQAGVVSWRTIWAEDGSEFYKGTGNVLHVFDPYNGYAVALSRTIGLGAHLFPIADLARYYAVVGALVTTVAAIAIWHFSAQLVTSIPLRIVLALSVILLPTLVGEQLANGVNTIWVAIFVGWWALLYRPVSGGDAIAPAAFVFVAATSSAATLLFVPVAVFLAFRRSDRPSRIVLAVFGAGLVVQVLSMVSSEAVTEQPRHLTDLPEIVGVRMFGSWLIGEHWLGDAWSVFRLALPVGAFVVVVGVFAFLVREAGRRRRLAGLVCGVYAVGLYCLCVWGRGTVALRVLHDYRSVSLRWSSLGIWFLLSGVVILVSAIPKRGLRAVATAVIVVQFIVTGVSGFRVSNARSEGPDWPAGVSRARRACAAHDVTTVRIPVSAGPAFDVVVRCVDLG